MNKSECKNNGTENIYSSNGMEFIKWKDDKIAEWAQIETFNQFNNFGS